MQVVVGRGGGEAVYMRLRLGPRGGRNYVWGGQGVPQERGCHFPGDGGFRASVSVLEQQVTCERTPGPSCPHTVLVRGHAGPVTNKLSRGGDLLGAKMMNQMVLESQLSHQIVNLSFTIANQNNKLTFWGGGWIPKSN